MSGEIGGIQFGIVTFILIALIIAASVLLFLSVSALNDKSNTIGGPNQAAGCLNPTCPSGNPNIVTVGSGTETVNYCSVNAAPTSFVQALQVCGTNLITGSCPPPNLPTITNDQITSFANFYNNSYIDSCSSSWGDTPNPVGQTDTLPASTTINALLACAGKRNLLNDPNIQSLKTKCGTACS
ncbi:MAG: hypothetical protein Solivirus4_2 [Solivirus sp.]|uniref:Uncharacterized protein n=1 Tax=Solivirus sp. TaxID=2487772 RepID=A0A3G5AIB1_9VIRU|nr:MAG: hypothetical protein Solivirus4_2 [Solivirus sp.]